MKLQLSNYRLDIPPPAYSEKGELRAERSDFFNTVATMINEKTPAPAREAAGSNRKNADVGRVLADLSSLIRVLMRSRPIVNQTIVSQTVVNHRCEHNAPCQQSCSEETQRAIIGLFSAVILPLASYFAAKAVAKYEDAGKKIKTIDGYDVASLTNNKDGDIEKLTMITENAKNFLKEIVKQTLWQVALRTALAAGAALVFVGAVVNAVNLVAAGSFLAMLSVCGLAYRYGIDSNTTQLQTYARQSMTAIEDLKEEEEELPPPYEAGGIGQSFSPSFPAPSAPLEGE
ncbi:MAG: hypothetical protein WB791_03780 [Waddliaceae bacterium]